MVSFSCERCNDVLTKKKLDAHRNSCRGATFVCLDCMRHFMGTDYRAHTSCVSEAEKYQGALYRSDKDRKANSSKASRPDPPYRSTSIPRKAYVEDAPDQDSGVVTIVDAPPHAPSPPPAPGVKQQPGLAPALPAVNVFDFLVNEDTPNGSRTTIITEEPMSIGHDAPTIVEVSPRWAAPNERTGSRETFGESHYAENGYHYGEGPVPIAPHERYAYSTPATNPDPDRTRYRNGEESRREHTKDRKRKRVLVEDLQLTTTHPQGDEIMTDAPPVLHSGLTGGLKGLLTRTASDYPPSPGYSSGEERAVTGVSPGSPLKRSKRHSAGNAVTTLITTRRRSTSDAHHHQPQHRLHKHHRRHRHQHRLQDEAGERAPRKVKTIKYRSEASRHHDEGMTSSNNNNAVVTQQSGNQLVLYRGRVDLFMSFVKKGPESEKGCSMNKALKRYHRERSGQGLGKTEEEKELWKSLRLRKNERGEIVLFAADVLD